MKPIEDKFIHEFTSKKDFKIEEEKETEEKVELKEEKMSMQEYLMDKLQIYTAIDTTENVFKFFGEENNLK